MKTLFIEAKYKDKVKISKDIIDKLPNKVCLVTTVQYIDSLGEIKKELEENKKEIILKKGKSKYPGQILGCDIDTFDAGCDAFLFIGDGMFHPKALLFKTGKEVFVYNPLSKEFLKLDDREIKKIKNKRKAAYVKFLSSKEIGVLVSVKAGQNRLKDAMELKNKLKEKNTYIFLADTLDFNQLENFPFIECWVNTMCPRIGLDDSLTLQKPIINIEDLK